MTSAVASRFFRAPVFGVLATRRLSLPSSPVSADLAKRTSKHDVSSSPSPTSQTEMPLASSFIAPLPIPGIRRAPRTPTLPADSKFIKYSGAIYDRMFPFVLTATFLLPLGFMLRYF